MPLTAFALIVLVVTLGGCSSGADIGESCHRHGDCEDSLQCVKRVCMARCQRAPDCGDGYACDEGGLCQLAKGQAGDSCIREVDCAPGLSCRIDAADSSQLIRRCAIQTTGAPAGAACSGDADCRNGTCALGRCVDMCSVTRDCAAGTSCMRIPHESRGTLYGGCLVSNGVISWKLPAPAAGGAYVHLPVPSGASQASVVMSTAPARTVAANQVIAPSRRDAFRRCPISAGSDCTEAEERDQYYLNDLRHRRERALSVLAIPSTSRSKLETGLYRVDARSFHPDGSPGPAPALTAVVRLGAPSLLDLHFHFLDMTDHPCQAAFGSARLDGTTAQMGASFQHDFLDNLGSILKQEALITVDQITYEDVVRPDLDGLELGNVGELLRLGQHASGVNVFFVRNLSPVGVQAYSPNPGPAGLAGTPRSGIVIGLDTLCYRSWRQLARLTAHEIARYMGLYPNVELGGQLDAIDDSDTSSGNLMFFSELGGTSLSPGQRDILSRSPVLR